MGFLLVPHLIYNYILYIEASFLNAKFSVNTNIMAVTKVHIENCGFSHFPSIIKVLSSVVATFSCNYSAY